MQKPAQDLRVRTRDFALQIIRLYSSLPKTTEAQVIGKQMLRHLGWRALPRGTAREVGCGFHQQNGSWIAGIG